MDITNPTPEQIKMAAEEICDVVGAEDLAILRNAMENNSKSTVEILSEVIKEHIDEDQCPECLSRLNFKRTSKRFNHIDINCSNYMCDYEDSTYDPHDI